MGTMNLHIKFLSYFKECCLGIRTPANYILFEHAVRLYLKWSDYYDPLDSVNCSENGDSQKLLVF